MGLVCGSAAILGLGYRADLDPLVVEREYRRPTSRFLSVAGHRTHYMREGRCRNAHGKASGGAGRTTVLLLHGVSSSLYAWDGWAAHLSPRYCVIRLDLPGSGLTGPVPGFGYRVRDYVQFTAAFHQALGSPALVIGGNSLGGGVAWRYALDFPSTVRGIILVGAIGFPPPSSLVNTVSASAPGRFLIRWFTPEWSVRMTLALLYTDAARVSVRQVRRHQRLILRAGNRTATVQRLALQDEALRPKDLSRLRQPVLLLWGANDSSVPVEHARRFRQRIGKTATLRLIPNAGHIVMEERPVVSARVAERFLQGL